ncbi:MAG: PilZ domain-containing protein [Myxococcota bacterium]
MGASPPVLLLDDGELDDFQKILGEIGVAYGRIRGGAIVPETPPPEILLIATPRRIDAVAQLDFADVAKIPVQIVVVDGDSRTLRNRLREIGFDYLIRRPVHPEAIRLLLLRCIYSGAERRGDSRAPAGFEVSFRAGFRRHRATLTDLSLRSCRLQSDHALALNKRIRLKIPAMLGIGTPFVLSGRIARTTYNERSGEDGVHRSAIVFENLGDTSQEALASLLGSMGLGLRIESGAGPGPGADAASSPSVSPRPFETPASPPNPSEAETKAEADRRLNRRAAYVRNIPAYGEQATRVLVGQDLSARGMRVKHADIADGDRLHIALYGEAGKDPILVWATADRDDGEDGTVLIFEELESAAAHELEKLVARLPSVEPLAGGEIAAMGSVVGEILPEKQDRVKRRPHS